MDSGFTGKRNGSADESTMCLYGVDCVRIAQEKRPEGGQGCARPTMVVVASG